MGIGVSGWRLAHAVSSRGQLGVVSGTALDNVLVRRLEDGDAGGHVRRAMEHFPWPAVAEDVLRRFYRPAGRGVGMPYSVLAMYRQKVSRARQEITVLANFVETWLAKEGHEGVVGVNLLAKVQMPTLPSLYGAMLAGVDYVLMGAGIPREIPGVLDRLAVHETATLRLDVEDDASGEATQLTFEPRVYWPTDPAPLERPRFLPIVSASSLALMLARKANGRVDGFVVEGPTAGGHNAPPRGRAVLNEHGEPVYGERDVADLAQMREIGLPFWLAGGAGSPDALREALAEGAQGIQVGTLFAYADESGLTPELRAQVIEQARDGTVDVRTDALASPTGYPFKVVQLEGTNARQEECAARERVCDLGYLRVPYRMPSGRIDYRCAAEPVGTYVKKGGSEANTVNRKCLCNALLADIGHPQERGDRVELPLVTSGDDVKRLGEFLRGRERYSAADVLEYLLGEGDYVAITPSIQAHRSAP
jgi:NAD(P)H-dependent flavin oxidoreductase YrpB (nitropropane dioxygenase family)